MTSRTHVKMKLSEAGFIAEEAGELADRMLKSIPSSLRDDNLFFEFAANIKNLCKWNGHVPAQDARRELYVDPTPLFAMWKLAYDEKSPVMKTRSERLEKRLVNLREAEKPKPKIGFEVAAKVETTPQVESAAEETVEMPARSLEKPRESLGSYLQNSPSLTSIAAGNYSSSLFFNQAAPPQNQRMQTLATGNRHARRKAQALHKAQARHNEPS